MPNQKNVVASAALSNMVGDRAASITPSIYGNVGNNPMQQSKYNPYQGLDPKTNLSLWNRFTDLFGFTNHAGQLDYQQSLASNQYESELALLEKQNEYNSPLEQAKRMREAGLNPDLLGVENYEAQLAGNPANQPSASSGIAQAAEAANNSFSRVLSSAFEGLKTFIGIKEGLLSIDQKQLENDLLQDDIAETIGNRILRDTDFPEDSKETTLRPAWKVGEMFRSKKLSRGLENWLNQNYGALRHNIARYGERKTSAENRNLALEEEANPLTSGKSDAEAVRSLKFINNMAYDLQKLQYEFAQKLAKYNIDDINDRHARKLYESNNEVQKLVNDFKKNTQSIINRHLQEHLNDRGLMAQLIQHSMLMGQVGGTDLLELGAHGLGIIGGVALNALLRNKAGSKGVQYNWPSTTHTFNY